MENEILKGSLSIMTGMVNTISTMINSILQTTSNSFNYLFKSIQFLIIQPILNLIKLIIFIIILLPLHIILSIVFGFNYNNKLNFNLFEIFNEFLQILNFFYQFLAISILFGIIIGLVTGLSLFIIRYLFTWSFSSFEIFSLRSIAYKILNFFGVIKIYNYVIDIVSTVTNNYYDLKSYKFEDDLKKGKDDKISGKMQSPRRKSTLSPSPSPTPQRHSESFKLPAPPNMKLYEMKLSESLQQNKLKKKLEQNTINVEQFKEFLSVDKVNDEIEIKYEITTTPSDLSMVSENIKKNQLPVSTEDSNKDKKPLWSHNDKNDDDSGKNDDDNGKNDDDDLKGKFKVQELNSKIDQIDSSEESSRISTAATQSGYDTSNILQDEDDEDEDDGEADEDDDYYNNQGDKRGDTAKDDNKKDAK